MTLLWVLLGGAVGAPTRWVTDRLVRHRWRRELPLGTLVVNVVGSFLLGLVVARVDSPAVAAAVGTGFCGALTTYSTFAYEAVELAEVGRWRTAIGYVAGSVGLGLLAVTLGWWVGTGL